MIANYAAISSGLLSGSLHAITGPDHFMAILPLILHLRWWKSGFYGGCWGFGHGFCSFLLGLMGYFMKETFINFSILESLLYYRFLSDLMIGATLLVIGMMGLVEALEEDSERPETDSKEVTDLLESGNNTIHTPIEPDSCVRDEVTPSTKITNSVSIKTSIIRESLLVGTILVNGFVLGLSWDGLPSLTPTMVLSSSQTICFLLAYLVSTVIIMALVSALIGEASTWLSNRIHIDSDEKTQEHFSRRFTLMTSFVAFSIGMMWLCLGILKVFLLFSSYPGEKAPENDGIAMSRPNHNDGIMMMTSISPSLIARVEENNDGILLTNSHTWSSSYDFYLNLFVSSFSIVAMTFSIVMGILYPNNSIEQRMIQVSTKLQKFYHMWSNTVIQWKGRVSYLLRPLCLSCRYFSSHKAND